MNISIKEIKTFRNTIRRFYRLSGRSLPFRETNDPYAITVSEIMLQQTQVDRVIPKYLHWLKKFPDWYKLSKASNKDILYAWSGLGYNRRALYLKKMALLIEQDYNGVLPDDTQTLMKFPGIGRYTSSAIAVFAFGQKSAAVDTNIRKVLLHTFRLSPETSDKEIQLLAERLLPDRKIREWHYALMDYAKTLPATVHKKYPPRSKQSKFDGSLRQIRGEIIRQLTKAESVSYRSVAHSLNRRVPDVKKAVGSLQKENIVKVINQKIYLIDQ